MVVEPEAVEADIEKLVQVQSVQVDKVFPNKIVIKISEFDKVAFLEKDGAYFPLLQNGKSLPKISASTVPTNAPILVRWGKEELIESMANELNLLSESIRIRISEIHHVPQENDEKQIVLYMNDGYEVHSRIENFAEYMEYYPSIIDKLDGNREGIIYISDSPRFEPFEQEEGKGKAKNEN